MDPLVFALCDCNNFFVSCERLFRPDLAARPVVVLSSNDGCIISRSNEAKALGISMGVPLFKVAALLRAGGVTAFSSNFALYQEISRRVMAVLSRFTDRMETYSVDEAFLSFSIAGLADPVAYARDIRQAVVREVGIPVSIGIAPTKTLAKLASENAKRRPEAEGVFSTWKVADMDAFLEEMPVQDVWGIGRRCAEALARFGIRTARRFRDSPDDWLRRHFTVRGVHTAWELRGISCIRLVESDPPQKSIEVSRSFGRTVEAVTDLREAVAAHAVTAGVRLREQKAAASVLQVHLSTSRFREGFFAPAATMRFEIPTSSTPSLIRAALDGLDRIYRPGHAFTKAGVALSELHPEGFVQQDLFDSGKALSRQRRERAFMAAVDEINRSLGSGALRPALLFGEKRWAPRQDSCSSNPLAGFDALACIASTQPGEEAL